LYRRDYPTNLEAKSLCVKNKFFTNLNIKQQQQQQQQQTQQQQQN